MVKSCNACGQQQRLKLTGIYARWYPFGTESIGYALQLCDECVATHMVPIMKAIYVGSFGEDTCPLCQEPGLERLEYTWLTCYARNEEEVRCTVSSCEKCSNLFRVLFSDHGKKLADRARPAEAPKPAYWHALGIHPQTAP